MEVELEEIASILKSARNKKKLKIDDIARQLKIRAAYIEAMENAQFPNIKSQIFRVGYLKAYSDFLGLNTKEILGHYRHASRHFAKDEIRLLESDPNVEEINPSKTIVILSLILIVITYSVWYHINGYGKPAIRKIIDNQAIEELITKSEN